MNIRFHHLLIVAAVMTAVHVTAVLRGWYEGRVVVDMPLHFAGGILLGMVWLWAMRYLSLGAPTPLLVAVLIIGSALLGSFLWELLEFGFWKFFPEYAGPLKLYSSTVADILSDLALGVLGGFAVAVFHVTRNKPAR